jgi:tetratricopeptide (TPR) repeat protein
MPKKKPASKPKQKDEEMFPLGTSFVINRIPPMSAQELYKEAIRVFRQAIDLSVYDADPWINAVMVPLLYALRKNPNHIKSLALLSDFEMFVGQNDEALPMLHKLRKLQPKNPIQQRETGAVKCSRSKQERIRDYIEEKWCGRSDY